MQPSYIYIVVTTGRTPLHEQLFCRCEQRLFRVAAAKKTEQPPYSRLPDAMFTGFLFRRPYTVVFEPFLAAHYKFDMTACLVAKIF